MLLSVHPPAGWVPPKKSLHPIEVTYLASPSDKSPSSKSTPSASAPPEAPVREVVRNPVPIPKKAPLRGTSLDENVKEAAPATPRVTPAKEAPHKNVKEAASLPEEPFALVRHKQQVKEHLKSHLTYPNLQIQGTVQLHLVLDSEGILQEASLVGPADPELAEAALQGAYTANPYPRFPKETRESKVTYDFLIQYRLE